VEGTDVTGGALAVANLDNTVLLKRRARSCPARIGFLSRLAYAASLVVRNRVIRLGGWLANFGR
jgi:hypothetical protein